MSRVRLTLSFVLLLVVTGLVTASKVVNVIDGDTVVLDTKEKVRLIGVDCPETSGPKGQQYFGTEATQFLDSLIDNKHRPK